MARKHPIQNVHKLNDGRVRFIENKIVSHLVDNYPGNLNTLAAKFMYEEPEDYEQLMMLIGYSLDGFAELCDSGDDKRACSYKTLAAADRKKVRQ